VGESRASFIERVRAAKETIARGDLEKVVLARAVRLAGRPRAPVPLVAALRELEPGCLAFAIVAPDGKAFVGATPERLVRRRGERALTGALAGSAPRGSSAEADEARAAALLASKKDRSEHALVVEAVRTALAPAGRISRPRGPRVLRLAQVQHLFTPMSVALSRPASVLELGARLHPTPAVAGTPRAAALAHLRETEPLDRGWYAGAVGWMDATGDGELAVSIRSALLDGRDAWLFAGAGIVAGSDPASEWDETEVKLRAMARALA
jgi:isochorismate synthase